MSRDSGFARWALVTSALLLGPAGPALAATITQASPQGEVARVQQVVLGFDAPVVAAGDPRRPDPATVHCAGPVPTGTGAWTTPQQWTYDFRSALPPGVSCTVSIKPGWQPLQGSLTGRTRFSFQTGGPSVERLTPWQGSTVEEDQHFLVQFNGAAADASVAANTWCEVEGVGERMPVQLVTGPARDAVLKARGVERQASRHVLLRCQRPLPQDARLRLVFGAGIAAQANPALATRAARSYEYRVRRAFQAEFTCERERAQAPCLPIRPMALRLSEPVARSVAEQARLKPLGTGTAAGAALAPAFDRDDKSSEVSEIRFPVPLAENARYAIELPAGFIDASGRPLANAGSFPLTVTTGLAPPIAKFAAAPFGILESQAEPVLPLTVRHVQGDLRPAAPAGQVRVLRLDEPVAMLKAYAQVRAWHEQQITAQEAGLPKSRWTETLVEKDARGRDVKRTVERYVGTRELSLLKQEPKAQRLDLPALQGGDPRPFEVVGIPLAQPGLHVVEIESAKLGAALLEQANGQPVAPMYVRTAVLVTNLAVHVKLARDGGLVWVTTLDRARPVPGAEVQIFDCRGEPRYTGRTDAQGRATIDSALKPAQGDCLADEGYFVTARKADAQGRSDTGFAFSSWNKGIDPWRFNLPLAGPSQGPDGKAWRAHTVFDRTLLRAGETVSMKHFMRSETASGLALLKPDERPTRARLVHEGSGREFTVPLQWSGVRSATSSWNIPAAAALGRYEVTLERDLPQQGGNPEQRSAWPSGRFRVEEFRVPLVDARLVAPKAALIAPAEAAFDVQMNYMAGGAMAQAALRGTALWRQRSVSFEAYPEFSFEAPREPSTGPSPEANDPDEERGEASAAAGQVVASRVPLTTNRDGAARWVVGLAPGPAAAQGQSGSAPSPTTNPPAANPPAALTRYAGELRAEVSYQDPNGETQTISTRVPTWPSAVVLGMRSAGWVSTRGESAVTVLALDTTGKPVKGQAVEVRGRLSQTLSTRKRMVGGFYAYDHRTEVQDLGVLCKGSTDAQGFLPCTVALQRAGEVELVAQARDAAGNRAEAATSVWVTRQGELWFAQDNDDRIDVLPERRRYEPGETARLQVRMPYREATALVAVEREGVVDSRVVTLRGSDPTVEVKIEPHWGPNVYVSVLAVRGRIREVPWYSFFRWGWREPVEWARAFWHEGKAWQAPTAMVDLSRPSAKFGVAALTVGVSAFELKVQVQADQPQYTIRGQAVATVKVTTADGKPAADAEVAFAAVDEGLLALQGNESWDLLGALVQQRAWGVETATGMSEVIGRRHYGRKAVPAGGGGGRAGARELFDTLLLWQPNVKLDAKGEATVRVPLNDSLTSFRLVAVADAGPQTFGHGHTSIRVTQDLQVLAGLPPLVREGDQFLALVTLRNTTAREMLLTATLAGTVNSVVNSAAGTGGTELARAPIALPPQEHRLAANSALEITWPVTVPAGATSISWEAAVQERGSGKAQDRARHLQLVKDAVPLRVLQASIHQLDGPLQLPLQAPADALAGPDGRSRGGVDVSAQARLANALPGLRRYFETYPYSCLEQLSSKAIGLRDEAAWSRLANALPTYLDSDGLAGYFPPRAGDPQAGSDRLTAHLVGIAHDTGWALPPAALNPMLQGLTAFVQGRIERRAWSPRADLDVRKLAAIAALARHGQADARLLGSLSTHKEAVAQWPTAALIDWLDILQRVADVPDRAARRAEAQQQLRARLQFAGTTLRFSQEDSDFWWWLMDSPDSNAARLLLAVMDEPDWRSELPKLVLGHLGRQKQGAWLTTTANAWSVVALERFSARYESTPVSGRTVATVAGAAPVTIDWKASNPPAAPVRAPWPAGGAAGTVTISHDGGGKPWVTVQSLAAIPLTQALRRGYGVTRSVTAVEQKTPGSWSRGDVMRVRLEVEATADMTWVVVSDPVPAGATILGTGLGRDAGIATQGERREGQAWPAFDERGFEAFRSYYAYLPKGRHTVEYTLRLNNPGRFALPPSRVEAMYAPETFGESPNAALEVKP